MTILADTNFSIHNIHPEHLVIFLVGYTIVFTSLAFLAIVFYNVPRLLRFLGYLKRMKPVSKPEAAAPGAVLTNGDLTGEQAAAISMALHLYISELHDEEHRILTIRSISRRYSPWSSKIYNVTPSLNKRF